METTVHKIALLQKIINKKLTKEELKYITDKAKEIINRRPGIKL